MSDERGKKEPEPVDVANKYHEFYKGKFSVGSKVPVRKGKENHDFAVWYTPGVAEPCKLIAEDKDRVYTYTNKGNMAAVVSNGTRVLGLGDIGPEAGLPVMEGKAFLFKYLGDVDAVPICVDEEDENEIINLVKRLEPTFGAINLEDIEKPQCFEILNRLRNELDIPVWHDDQQGTALVSLAALIGALKFVGKNLKNIKLVIGGAGAAGIRILDYAIVGGVKAGNITVLDSKGILSPTRVDLNENNYKYKWAKKTNPDGIEGDMADALNGADVCISATIPGPGVIKKDWVAKMADDAIVFGLAQPVPEILPEEAKKAGARVVGTGRSDYPNQVNNSLGFPAMFRGLLEVNATDITEEMCITAAHAIAERAEEIGLTEDFIIPRMGDMELYVKEAVAVAKKAIEQNVARRELPEEELEDQIRKRIKLTKTTMQSLMREGLIPELPD